MDVHATEPKVRQSTPATCGGVSAQLLEDGVLHPAMDGTVLNLQQYNPSPEIDSDLEHALEANRRGDTEATEKWILAAIGANHREGQMLRTITGTADEATASLRSVRGKALGLSGRRVVAKLTGPLGQLLQDPQDFEAARVVVEVVRATPISMLRSKQTRHQLGKRKFAKLEEFLEGQG